MSKFGVAVPNSWIRVDSRPGYRHPIVPSPASILIVEDDEALARVLGEGLRAEGFEVTFSADGENALAVAEAQRFDAIVLDLMLPRLNGFRVCQLLRERGDDTPVLVLTAKQGDWDETEALETGADDYVKKPFAFHVLLARLRALLRRRGPGLGPVLRAGDLRLDTRTRRCWRGEAEILLTPREYDLLDVLFGRLGEPATKRELLDEVWDFALPDDSNLVEVYIGYLRRKLDEPFGRRAIQTVRRQGYRIDPDGG
jgi:DNA-binding response OmpR family regulator